MQKVFYEEMGKKIQNLRKERGLSQKELAKAIGKNTASYITLIETGKRRVSLHSLTKLADALKVSLNAFFDKNYEAMDSDSLLNLALISDPNLTPDQRESILDFVKFLRTRNEA